MNNSGSKKVNSDSSIIVKKPGRPKKIHKSPAASASPSCTWCGESKTPLKYVLPTQTGKKEFCSETCIAVFRKAYNKGACAECDNVIRTNAPSTEFCSTYCMNKNKNKNKNGASALVAQNSNNRLSLNNNNLPQSSNNNNNKDSSSVSSTKKLMETNNNKDYGTKISQSPMFQYERFQVFDWKDYLKVRIFN